MSKKIYFASDFHLGLDLELTSAAREAKIVRWLKAISVDAEIVYLIGDIFDYWFEYKLVIPKGCIKLISQLSHMRDLGIEIVFFRGNHDMWLFDYFTEELGIKIYTDPQRMTHQGKQIVMAHGDGLGPGDHAYKLVKKIFSNKLCQWLFARIHPNTGIAIMKYISGSSNREYGANNEVKNTENEWLISYCEEHSQRDEIDYFIFGHRHLAIDHLLSNGKTRYINTGDWIEYFSYAVLDQGILQLKYFKDE